MHPTAATGTVADILVEADQFRNRRLARADEPFVERVRLGDQVTVGRSDYPATRSWAPSGAGWNEKGRSATGAP